MQFPRTSKVEKVASKDWSRPVLCSAYLNVGADGAGTLEATDSYKLVRIPVTVDETDVAGLVPVDAIAAARKERCYAVDCNGTATVQNGASFPRPDGQFPDAARLWPTDEPTLSIGLNARFLYDLAQAMGSDGVRIDIINPLRPFVVTPLQGDVTGADGLLMPVRLAS